MEATKLDLGELITQMADAYNAEVDDFDNLVQELADSRNENEALLKELKFINNGVSKIETNAKKHMTQLEQALREKEQIQDRLIQQEMLMKSYKEIGSPKKIRESIKGYKAKIADNLKATTAHKKTVKTYRDELDLAKRNIETLRVNQTQNNITSVWSEAGQHLMIFPAPLTMAVNEKEEKQMTLLFMDGSGTGKLIGLDEDGAPLLCRAPPGGLKPKARTLEVAGSMLRKFKKQGWALTKSDLKLDQK